MDPVYNAQNDRYINFYDDSDEEEKAGNTPSGRYIARSKHPASAVFLGAVASTGEFYSPIWFPTGFRLAADPYIDVYPSSLDAAGGRGPWGRALYLPAGLRPCPQSEEDPAVFGQPRPPILDPGGVAS